MDAGFRGLVFAKRGTYLGVLSEDLKRLTGVSTATADYSAAIPPASRA